MKTGRVIDQLTILGVGLLGGSVGLAARARGLARVVVGHGHRAESLDAATRSGAIDRGTLDLADAVADASLVVVCTPVGQIVPAVRRLAALLPAGAIVTDVGSTKASIVAACEPLMPSGRFFVGSHPMAGGEKKGVAAARADLFDDAVCVLTPTAATHAAALDRVDDFWRALGGHTVRCGPADHDARVALVSHLPHAVAAALVAVQTDAALALAGPGFRDTTRVAAGDPALWRDIFLDNAGPVADALDACVARLTEFRAAIRANDAPAVEAFLAAAARRRADS